LFLLLLRHRKKAPNKSSASPSIEPTTAPAIVPEDTLFREGLFKDVSGSAYGTGVEVTVCVTTAPERVTTCMLVTGLGVNVR